MARLTGTCIVCEKPIVPDEDEVVCIEDEIVHAACAEDEGHEVERAA